MCGRPCTSKLCMMHHGKKGKRHKYKPVSTNTHKLKRDAQVKKKRENWKILLQLHLSPSFLPSVHGRKRKRRTKPKPEITWHRSPFSPIQRGERVSSKLAPMTPWLFPYTEVEVFLLIAPRRGERRTEEEEQKECANHSFGSGERK